MHAGGLAAPSLRKDSHPSTDLLGYNDESLAAPARAAHRDSTSPFAQKGIIMRRDARDWPAWFDRSFTCDTQSCYSKDIYASRYVYNGARPHPPITTLSLLLFPSFSFPSRHSVTLACGSRISHRRTALPGCPSAY